MPTVRTSPPALAPARRALCGGCPCRAAAWYRRNAIPAIPTDVVDAPTRRSTPTVQRALTGPQLALLATQVGERHPVYGLIVLFMAYTGLRCGEAGG